MVTNNENSVEIRDQAPNTGALDDDQYFITWRITDNNEGMEDGEQVNITRLKALVNNTDDITGATFSDETRELTLERRNGQSIIVSIPGGGGTSTGGLTSSDIKTWALTANALEQVPTDSVQGLATAIDKINKLAGLIPYSDTIEDYFDGSSHSGHTENSITIEDGWNNLMDVRTPNDLVSENADFYLQDGITKSGTNFIGFSNTGNKLVYLGVPNLSGNDRDFKVLFDMPVVGQVADQTLVRFNAGQYQINTSHTATPNWTTVASVDGAVNVPDGTASGIILQLEELSTTLRFVPVIHYGDTIVQCNDIDFNTSAVTLDYTRLNFRSEAGYRFSVAEPSQLERHSGLAALVRDHLDTKWVFGKALLTTTVTDDSVTIVTNVNHTGRLQKNGVDVATTDDTTTLTNRDRR